ncbi:DODA-type extradiol aromatic ring-opening family dioxygenase [Nocardia sp. R6R-6]|uniref:DODA-type extradiol aromatic ring-opening family dioxygenase n=1 Tax=Nocardia sp. R6R-6 TaxID=3459303 RepID=UPI00403D9464
MGEIACGFATSHVMFPKAGVEEQAQRVADGFAEIGRQVKASGADLVVLVSSEHGPTLLPSGPQPPFAIGTGETFRTFGDMDVPRVTLPAHSDFARGFVRYAATAGFDIAPLTGFRADHGTAIPALMIFPEKDVAIVPLIVSSTVPEATATAARCYLLGQALAAYIESRSEKVAVIGCGGLSHWPGMPQMGRINEEFDHVFLDLLSRGNGAQAAEWSTEYILENAGNGGLEIRNWILASAAVGDKGGKPLYYEPMYQWVTGMAAFEFAN